MMTKEERSEKKKSVFNFPSFFYESVKWYGLRGAREMAISKEKEKEGGIGNKPGAGKALLDAKVIGRSKE